jgi:hypothetical protein
MTPSRFCSAEGLQPRAEAGPQRLQREVSRRRALLVLTHCRDAISGNPWPIASTFPRPERAGLKASVPSWLDNRSSRRLWSFYAMAQRCAWREWPSRGRTGALHSRRSLAVLQLGKALRDDPWECATASMTLLTTSRAPGTKVSPPQNEQSYRTEDLEPVAP